MSFFDANTMWGFPENLAAGASANGMRMTKITSHTILLATDPALAFVIVSPALLRGELTTGSGACCV